MQEPAVDEFGEPRSGILARIPKGLTDPSCRIRYLPGAVKKYRAYLSKKPLDGGAWEGLGYLYLRMASEEPHTVGITAEDLGDPPATSYSVLSYEAEKKASELRPTSVPLRYGLRLQLGNALSPYQNGGPENDPLVQALGGVKAARTEYLALIDDTLDLMGQRELGGYALLDWQTDRAQLLQEMEDFALALSAWELVLSKLDGWTKENEYDWPGLANPQYVHLSLFECALKLGNFKRAEQELKAAGKSFPYHRYELLHAKGQVKAAQALAKEQAAKALRQHQKAPEDAYLLQAADWYEMADDLKEAERLLQQVARGSGYGQASAKEKLRRSEFTSI